MTSLAIILLISGIDDFLPVLICIRAYLRQAKPRTRTKAANGTKAADGEQRSIAIFVPCWQEADIIGDMVRRNIAAIKYRKYEFFVGTYPNDRRTVAEVQKLANLFGNVHGAMCPHAGPTSKADCLNAIYARMEELEIERGMRFDTVLLHDAEDIIHPDALQLINRMRADYEMVQVPVLPLRTGLNEITHGIYCDEFAEFQTIDMLARQHSGAFVPSNGVGTGFSREVLAHLASRRNGEIFDPASLTEDYQMGVDIYTAGWRQTFAPLRRAEGGWLATREYFPRKLKPAIRQRTRWLTGICLQCWERVGWQGGWSTKYWFWRDRKGLLANPLSLLANLVSLTGTIDFAGSRITHRLALFDATHPAVMRLCSITLLLQISRLSLRASCVARTYGLPFAAGVPIRAVYANLVNCCASLAAIWQYVKSRIQQRKLIWQKTDHVYPSALRLPLERRDLFEVLVECGCLSFEQAVALRNGMPARVEAAAYLLETGLVSEDALCLALSVQCGVQAVRVNLDLVKKHVLRSLPAHVEERYGVLPFDVQQGRLAIAGWLAPRAEVLEHLKALTSLDVEFHVVRSSDYQALRELCYGLRSERAVPRAGSNRLMGESPTILHFSPLRTRRTASSALRSSV